MADIAPTQQRDSRCRAGAFNTVFGINRIGEIVTHGTLCHFAIAEDGLLLDSFGMARTYEAESSGARRLLKPARGFDCAKEKT